MSTALIVTAALSFATPSGEALAAVSTEPEAQPIQVAQSNLRTKLRRSRCDWQNKIQGKRCGSNPGSHPKRRSSGRQAGTITRFADPQLQVVNPRLEPSQPKRVRVAPVVQQPAAATTEPAQPEAATKAETPQSFWAWVMGFFL
ncbi:MAG: hypothetical protein AAF416_10925 [Pseudomonadota bacterium]